MVHKSYPQLISEKDNRHSLARHVSYHEELMNLQSHTAQTRVQVTLYIETSEGF